VFFSRNLNYYQSFINKLFGIDDINDTDIELASITAGHVIWSILDTVDKEIDVSVVSDHNPPEKGLFINL